VNVTYLPMHNYDSIDFDYISMDDKFSQSSVGFDSYQANFDIKCLSK